MLSLRLQPLPQGYQVARIGVPGDKDRARPEGLKPRKSYIRWQYGGASLRSESSMFGVGGWKPCLCGPLLSDSSSSSETALASELVVSRWSDKWYGTLTREVKSTANLLFRFSL